MTDLEKYLKEVKERCESLSQLKKQDVKDSFKIVRTDVPRLVEMVEDLIESHEGVYGPDFLESFLYRHLNGLARGDK